MSRRNCRQFTSRSREALLPKQYDYFFEAQNQRLSLVDTLVKIIQANLKTRRENANERKRILEYLAPRDDIYSLAIQLDFYLCVRIGELLAVKYEDIEGGFLHINRSMRGTYKMDDGITKISSLLGHADTATTWHYIRKNNSDAATINAMKSLLD